MCLTSFLYLIFVFMLKIQISVQQDGQTSNNEIKDIILNFENRLDAKLADLQRQMSDYVDEKIELMEKSLTENFTKSLENTQLSILNVLGKVDGSWGSWGSWSSCDVSCGGGVQQRRRLCDDPAPAYTGQPCMGSDTEEFHCNKNECPIHGGWSSWSSWGACSSTCGTSNKRRFRTCTEPFPDLGGEQCDGDKTQNDDCNAEPCPIDDECPMSEGFFKVPLGERCYKFFHDTLRIWSEADSKCKSEGLALAEPADDIVLVLRRYIVDHIKVPNEAFTWVGGRYAGSRTYRFVRNQAGPLQANNALWGYDEPDPYYFNTDGCLNLLTYRYSLSKNPNAAYGTGDCDWEYWTLCEDVIP